MTSVRYPAKAAVALGFLKSHSNDIDVFVEDSAGRNLWVKLLRKFLPPGVRLNSVNTLGGRKEVLDACRADRKPTSRRRLYIIDADLDIARGQRRPRIKNLYMLRRYCIENYLLHQFSFVEAITSLVTTVDEVQAATICDLSSWLKRNEPQLRKLFSAYATAREVDSGLLTVRYSCHQLFFDNIDFDYCSVRTNRRVASLYRDLINEVGSARVRVAFDRVTAAVSKSDVQVYCSAKSYILPALYAKSK
jgi:hypothetical protein